MSSWGNLDNVTIAGTVVVATANANAVLGVSTYFTSNIKDGDYITIASNKYQVEKVLSDTSLYLTSDSATTSSGVKAFVQQGPKFIANVASGNLNDPTIQNVYGIDKVEIGVPENKARGVATHTGWVTYKTYSDAHSQTRHKSEVLVAMSKNFSANATNELFGTGAGQDANDDTVAADYLLYFTLQPVDTSNTAGGTASLIAAAASDPTGATLTYQWYKRDNVSDTTYAVVSEAGVSGATTNTLTIVNVSNVNGNIFRLTVSGDGGADDNTSTAVTVTAT